MLARRARFTTSAVATTRFAEHLAGVLDALEPESLGLYTAVQSEFNAAAVVCADRQRWKSVLALPCARRQPVEMTYRRWNGAEPTLRDDFGIASADGAVVVPEVVLVPCVGFTSAGHRLGYGGGYFDRWLAAHPGVTSVGIAWSVGRVPDDLFAARPHDVPLTLVVTEDGVMG